MAEEDEYIALPTVDGPGSPDLAAKPWTRGERLLSALGRRRRLVASILACLVLVPTIHFTPAGSVATQRFRSWRDGFFIPQDTPLRPPVAPPSGRCPSILDPPRPLVPALGEEADATYDGIGSVCLPDYREELAIFLKRAFPTRDVDAGDPDSILSSISRYLNSTLVQVPVDAPERAAASSGSAAAIPKRIHQTVEYIDAQATSMTQSWPSFHPAPDWRWQLSDDGMMDDWVRETFRRSTGSKGGAKQRLNGQEVTWLLSMWRRLESTPVMRADLWRYLKLLKEGGICPSLASRAAPRAHHVGRL